MPLYLLGAPLREFTPQLPLFQNQGLAVAAMSYLGKVHFGITADRDLVPDLDRFADALLTSFDELKSAAFGKQYDEFRFHWQWKRVVLSVERLDYSKGLLRRVEAPAPAV